VGLEPYVALTRLLAFRNRPRTRDTFTRQQIDVSKRAITLEGVSYQFPTGLSALLGVDLDITQGQILGIIGPSGCGKSTLLYLLAGIYQPTNGLISWPPIDPQAQHRLAMVFQKDTLLPWLNVEDNIGLYYRFHHVDRAVRRSRIAELVRLGSLQGFEKSYPYQLSGGMRRRAAFLSAVAPAPEILLLDEPFSSLDEPTRVGIHQDIFNVMRRLRMTAVLVTHDLAEALSLCDKVAIFTNRPGRVFSLYEVPFGLERNVMDLRQTPSFLELYGMLWHDLSLQISGSSADARARQLRELDQAPGNQ
jgi:ABC-type nitrate/sulfonate/bicarbonate transport system ATPase subunit